jgi:hypothetical protein
MYTLETVYAVSFAGSHPILGFLEFGPTGLFLSTLVVVGDHNGFIIQQNTLQPAVRTSNDTDLFPKPGKDEIEHGGEYHQGDEGAEVSRGSFGHIPYKLIAAYQVGQEHVGDQEGDQKEDDPLEDPLADLFRIPRHFIQADLFAPVPVDPVLYATENHFHEDSLRTYPTTKDPAVGHGKENDEYHPDDHHDHEDVKILWPKRKTKDIEAPFQDVQQQELVTTYLYERSCEKESQQ